jgi:hypothetical protein
MEVSNNEAATLKDTDKPWEFTPPRMVIGRKMDEPNGTDTACPPNQLSAYSKVDWMSTSDTRSAEARRSGFQWVPCSN